AWTYARSAYVGVAAAAVLLLVVSRLDRRILAYIGVGAIVGLTFAVGTNAYDRTFASSDTAGSTLVREERLPFILASAAENPFVGKGLASVSASGIRTTDSLFLLTYAEIGAIGVAGLSLLLVSTLVWLAPGLRAPPPDRLLAGATLCGGMLGIASGAFVDSFAVSGLARTFWLTAAIGVVVAERVPRRSAMRRPQILRRALLPVAGVAAGLVVLAVAPTEASATLRYTTRSPSSDVVSRAPSPFADQVLVNTTCAIIEARTSSFDFAAQCYDLQSEVGMAEVRFAAPDRVKLQRAIVVAATVVRRQFPGVTFFVYQPSRIVRATLVRIAPVWLGIVGAAVALLVPPLPPRRRDGLRRSTRRAVAIA
ncbi:MAG: O-antigen ligase family protein, partial [Actinomycetota bacterium]